MASSPDFNFKVSFCSNCGRDVIDGYCNYCEEEVAELPSLDDYDVFDDIDVDDESPE